MSDVSSCNETYELAGLASYNSREIILYHNSHESTYRSKSLSSPLHISSSGDFVEALLEICYDVDPMVCHRTNSPLCGIHCISPEPYRLIVLHQTAFGDIFYQNFKNVDRTERETLEASYRQGPGRTKSELKHKVARQALDWTRSAMDLMVFKTKDDIDSQVIDASNLLKGIHHYLSKRASRYKKLLFQEYCFNHW